MNSSQTPKIQDSRTFYQRCFNMKQTRQVRFNKRICRVLYFFIIDRVIGKPEDIIYVSPIIFCKLYEYHQFPPSFLPGTASILNIASAVLTLSIRPVSLPCSSSRTNRRPSPERIANSSCVSPASFLLVFINCAILFTENHLRSYNLNTFYTL